LSVRVLLWLIALVAFPAAGADLRARMRALQPATTVSQSQAEELTLTLTDVQIRPIQNWVRTAATLAADGRTLTAYLSPAETQSVVAGQRGRVFSADSKSSMFQAKVTRLVPQAGRTLVEAVVAGNLNDLKARYLLEIVVDYGAYLSVPNEAIIEEGDHQVVYVKTADGGFEPRSVVTRLQGERYTQVLEGVIVGEQVATTGSFFIDAEHKMKGGN
jgi:hypothetical protein